MQNIIAVIWDFDKTLIDGNMQDPIFEEYHIDKAKFWQHVNAISAGELSNEGNALQLADFNCDGFVNIVDATLIARAALGLN